MTTDPEAEFRNELQVFSSEVDEAIQCFYAEQTIQNVARGSRSVYDSLNRNAAFWRVTSRALQANAIIVLGRIFDRDSRAHGIRSLLNVAANHPEIFSKAALEKRKRPQAGQWTDEIIRGAYVPTRRELARLEAYVNSRRTVYNAQYKALRDKFYAHKERSVVTGIFAGATIPALERLLVFLDQLHSAFWHLFWNGLKPVLRPARHSGRSILKTPERLRRSGPTQEWITTETEKFLRYVASSYERERKERNVRPRMVSPRT